MAPNSVLEFALFAACFAQKSVFLICFTFATTTWSWFESKFGTPGARQGSQRNPNSRNFRLLPCASKVVQRTPNIPHCVQKTLFLLPERSFWRRRTLLYLVFLRKMPLGGFSKPPKGAQNGSPGPFSDPRGSRNVTCSPAKGHKRRPHDPITVRWLIS